MHETAIAGAISGFFAEPSPMQLARLYRVDGKNKMAIVPCEAVSPSQGILDDFNRALSDHQLPTLFAKVEFDLEAFVDEYGSNHISGVAGYYEKELVEVCKLFDIEYTVYK